MMYDPPILICYDGSEGSRGAIAAAAPLLGLRRAVVLDLGPPLTPAESLAAVSSLVVTESFEELNVADAFTRATEGAQLARTVGFRATARAGIGAPTWEAIVDVADEIGAVAIVIGSRALTGAQELLEGSVSHAVAQHAGRPVLIVPPPRDDG
jgi:nucleotide-binding universal stress UspA family protein